MPVVPAVALAFAALVVAFGAVWLVQLRTGNAGMIDPVWALTLGGVAVFAGAVGPGAPLNRVAVALGGGAWGLRLGVHLWRRNRRGPEDARYAALRERWGEAAPRRMLGFFMLQAVISIVLSIAFFVPAWQPQTPAIPAIVGALGIGFAALAGEAAADRELRSHLADPANRGLVCMRGWWRYSRHPNYFFETLHWCAYTVWSAGQPWGWLTLVPPCAMAWLLLRLSGVPLLEARLVHTRAGYREYMATTSAFVPWPARRAAASPPGALPRRHGNAAQERDESQDRP
jgi:steroid 5-alpha reductase family enzyme